MREVSLGALGYYVCVCVSVCARARANSGLCVAAACRLWWGGGRLTPEPSVCAGTEAAVPPARSPTGNLFPVLTSSCLLTFFFHLCSVNICLLLTCIDIQRTVHHDIFL